jgi:putative hemolysin
LITPVIILVVLIFVNGLFAMAETAVVSSRKSRLKQRAQEGNKSARIAYKLAKNPSRFLATVQVGITIIGIMSGAFAEERLAAGLAEWLRPIPWLGEHRDGVSTALLVGALTYFSLVVGELIPKRIALMYPETIASYFARPMRWISHLARPLVKLLSFSSDIILRIMGIKPPKEEPVSPEELKVLIQEGASAGIFDQTEQDIVTNVFRLAERRTSSIMTPRTEIVYLDATDTPDQVREKILEEPHAFYPVVEGHLDHVMGVLSAKDIMARVLAGKDVDPATLMHRALIVPESISILQMLDSFRQNPAQIAFIADEYGSILGIVTQNQVVEAIVGEMPNLEERHEPDMVMRDDGTFLVNGGMAADDLSEKMSLPDMPERNHYDTVGGFCFMQLQRIPSVGDSFVWAGTRFEIVDMDGNRIDKILVTPAAQSVLDEQ